MPARERLDAATVRQHLTDRIEDLARELAGDRPVRIAHGKLRIGEHGRIGVELRGARRGLWCDYASRDGGDALDLARHVRGGELRDAIAWAAAWLGIAGAGIGGPAPLPKRPPPIVHEAQRPDTVPRAQALWREAMPAQGSLVETYLAGRGLRLPEGAPIRFHPACPRGSERWPAMLALMAEPLTGRPCGVHRTFLARDGRGKAPGPLPGRMALGRAGIIRLTPDEEVTAGLGIAEGIETALSVMQGFGWRPVWAATSAGGIRAFPMLPGVDALTVFADADGAGMDAAIACRIRWHETGREARIIAPPAGADFNDLIRKDAAA